MSIFRIGDMVVFKFRWEEDCDGEPGIVIGFDTTSGHATIRWSDDGTEDEYDDEWLSFYLGAGYEDFLDKINDRIG